MLIIGLFSWWYGSGWLSLVQDVRRRLRTTLQIFSVSILLRTMFSPWRRIMTYPGASIGDHFRAMVDNLISRLVGFIVRLLALVASLIILLLVGLVGLLELIFWPLLPLAVVAALAKGIIG